MKNYDVVIIGNYTKDTIVSPAGRRLVDGGGFNYGAHVAAMMGLKTAAITRLSKNDIRVVESLRETGVDPFPLYTEHSTELELYYPTSDVDQRILTVTHTAGSFTPDQVEDFDAKLFLINTSTRGEAGMDVIDVLKSKNTTIAADSQGFVRIISEDGTLVNDPWEDKRDVLPYIDVLKTDAVEAEILTGESDIRKASRLLAEWGPGEIVLTHRGGLLVLAGGHFHEAKFHPVELIGRSGRGDTCIAAYACKRLSAPPPEATVWAAAVTSLKMEAEGPIRRNISDVERLIQNKYLPD
ncbi:MAG: PfkB family carbohydrate kinase [candidate division KSB1 bacterium]|jgi:sugar/nucleoside kinase (ribokinase family)|nr:PfkB family carbohydrate kinase [candidate division KSB1 bacterium]